jgi:hypothetical protein
VPALLLIKTSDNNIPQSGGRWLRGEIVAVVETTTTLGSGELNTDSFLRFELTDKTVAEMQNYLDAYNRDIDMNVVNGPDPQGFRRINARNLNSNASETLGGWSVSGTDDIVLEWNSRYPTCNLTTVGFPQYDTWTCEGTFTTGQAVEFNNVIIEEGLEITDKRKIWYISAAMMTAIENNGGFLSGDTSNLGPNLKDARLD